MNRSNDSSREGGKVFSPTIARSDLFALVTTETPVDVFLNYYLEIQRQAIGSDFVEIRPAIAWRMWLENAENLKYHALKKEALDRCVEPYVTASRVYHGVRIGHTILYPDGRTNLDFERATLLALYRGATVRFP